MRTKRFLLTCGVLVLIAIAWNAFVHLVVFRAANASVQHLRRPDLGQKAWLSLLLTAGIVMVFVWGYGRFARSGSLREGLGYGLFFALLTGLLVDLNQYVLFPIPAVVAAQWFLGGLVEFSLYGIIATRLYPPRCRQGGGDNVSRVSVPFRSDPSIGLADGRPRPSTRGAARD